MTDPCTKPSLAAPRVTEAMIENALAAANGAMVDTRRHWNQDDRATVRAMLEAALSRPFAEIVEAAQKEADRRISQRSSTVAPVAWRFRKTDALGEPMGPWLFSSECPNFELYEPVQPLYAAPPSATAAPITANDRRWRHLEHGCQWVSWTEIGGETHSFDPRNVTGYDGDLQHMRACADEQAERHLATLRAAMDGGSQK